jgi:hypothetical protein
MTAWQPVLVQLPMAGRQTIHGPYAALMALLIDWPQKRSAYYRAVKLCSIALDDETVKSRARQEFQNAAIQAGVGPLVYQPPSTAKSPRLRIVASATLSSGPENLGSI